MRRWPTFVDGFGHVVERTRLAEPGSKVVWESGPAGRGRVTEKRHGRRRPRLGRDACSRTQLAGSSSPRSRGPRTGGHVFRAGLDYELAKGGPLRALDRRPVHPPGPDAGAGPHLRRFSTEAAERGDAVACRGPLPRRNRHVRIQSRRRRRRHDGRRNRPGDQLRRHPSSPQGHRPEVRRQGLDKAGEVSQIQTGSLVKKEKITQEQADQQVEEILGRITGTTDYDELRRRRLRDRGRARSAWTSSRRSSPTSMPSTPGHAILASNTSGLSITEMGDATLRPDKVVGFHFFWPASMMRLIEVIEGEDDLRGHAPDRDQLRAGDPQDAGALRRGPGLRRQPHPDVGAPPRSGARSRSRARRRGGRPEDPGVEGARRWGRSSSRT